MKKLGKCSYCGSDIIETDKCYRCENQGSEFGQHDIIWKNSLENRGGCMLDIRDAEALFLGQTIKVQLKSRKTGNFYTGKVRYNTEEKKVEISF